MAQHQWAWQRQVLQDIRFYCIPKAKKKKLWREEMHNILEKCIYLFHDLTLLFRYIILFPASIVSLEITTLKIFKILNNLYNYFSDPIIANFQRLDICF